MVDCLKTVPRRQLQTATADVDCAVNRIHSVEFIWRDVLGRGDHTKVFVSGRILLHRHGTGCGRLRWLYTRHPFQPARKWRVQSCCRDRRMHTEWCLSVRNGRLSICVGECNCKQNIMLCHQTLPSCLFQSDLRCCLEGQTGQSFRTF